VVLEYGFDTYAGFYRAFVKMYGCSPKKYLSIYQNTYQLNRRWQNCILKENYEKFWRIGISIKICQLAISLSWMGQKYREMSGQLVKNISSKLDCCSIEDLFFNTNAKTVIAAAQGRGVCVLCASAKDLPVYEYTPLQVKQAVVGYGRAAKGQVQQMIKIILNLNEIPKPDDAADALAVAICHAHSLLTAKRI
jgi:crossover junction endodeoxyribonuclease RuvC